MNEAEAIARLAERDYARYALEPSPSAKRFVTPDGMRIVDLEQALREIEDETA